MMRRLLKGSVYNCFCPKMRRLCEGSVQWSKYGYYENEGRRRAITILMPLTSNDLPPKILFIGGFRRFIQPITWWLDTGGEGEYCLKTGKWGCVAGLGRIFTSGLNIMGLYSSRVT